MSELFYVSAAVAAISGILVVTQVNAMRALINLVVLLLAVATVFFTLGAPFVAALQIIIYAGAIMVLFVFVVMILNLGGRAEEQERTWLGSVLWVVPVILAGVLLVLFIYSTRSPAPAAAVVGPKVVGASLFTTYLIGVELASILLLAALVAAFHFGFLPSRLEKSDE